MQDTATTWWFSELNKKLFFASYKKRMQYPELVKAYREGLAWLLKSELKVQVLKFPELSYTHSENTGLPTEVLLKNFEVLPLDETVNEVVWQQRYFFENQCTKGCLMITHPAMNKSKRKPDSKRTLRLIQSLLYHLTSPKW